ncbi:MAG: ABC transporter permease [Bacteroidota bacterium]
MNKHIPDKSTGLRFILKLFKGFCRPEYHLDIEGDLLELYAEKKRKSGVRIAQIHVLLEVLLLFRPSIIRPLFSKPISIPYSMYKHYFLISWRSLFNHKLYSLLNIGGLAIGIASFLLISLFVYHELSYDRFYPDSDQIYRIIQKWEGDEFMGTEFLANTPAGMAPMLLRKFPEVTHATTLIDNEQLMQFQGQRYLEKGLKIDPHFFEVFPLDFIDGSSRDIVQKNDYIILTESLAYKIFGERNPIGELIEYGDSSSYIVSGIVRDFPPNSSFQFSFFTSIIPDREYQRDLIYEEKWYSSSFQTFFRLGEGADPLALQEKSQAYMDEIRENVNPIPFITPYYFVQPLSDFYLETETSEEIVRKGNPTYVYLFSIIAALILLLACINYMNLAIARSIQRMKEVGLRKVIGAKKGQVAQQFLSESVLITGVALLIALGITYFLMPLFGQLLERNLTLDFGKAQFLLVGLFFLLFLVGIISGSYPAFYLSSLRPVEIFKGKILGSFSGLTLQRALIVAQYVISITLIIGSLVIYRQFQFIQQKELGYDRDHILTLPVQEGSVYENLALLQDEWSKNPNILSTTASSSLPINVDATTMISPSFGDPLGEEEGLNIYRVRTDEHYLKVFGMDLVAGRNFSREVLSDWTTGRMINETAAKALGWSAEEAVGKQIRHNEVDATILGVIKDFHMHSFHLTIQPLMLTPDRQYSGFISLKVQAEELPKTLDMLEKSLQTYSSYPFEYAFLDEKFDQLYKDEQKLGNLLWVFTCLAIVIASLGLFGLAGFSISRKTKEIGIRKVLGASTQQIVQFLSQDFLKLVLIAFSIATPIGWYAMHRWLEGFAYGIKIEWWVFALAGIGAILMALLTVSAHSIKAALANPIESLKNE